MNRTKEKKDTVQKDFIAFPDIMADTVNALLYQGCKLTKPENLWPGLTETIYQGAGKLRSQYEDLCKYDMADGKVRIMYLIANQTKKDSRMLLRKAGYTGGIYREQYEGKIRDVFPVIELVLYWGKSRWKSSRDMQQLFRYWKFREEFPEEIWHYIDNMKLHVFEMRYLPQETRELFQSDMRIVVDYLAEGDGYRSDRKVVHKAAVIRMIKVLSGETDMEDVETWLDEQGIREEDEVTVCELFDQYVRQGREEGREEGIVLGKAEGVTAGRIEGEARRLVTDIENVMKFFQVTLEKACEGLGTTVSRYEEAKKLL